MGTGRFVYRGTETPNLEETPPDAEAKRSVGKKPRKSTDKKELEAPEVEAEGMSAAEPTEAEAQTPIVIATGMNAMERAERALGPEDSPERRLIRMNAWIDLIKAVDEELEILPAPLSLVDDASIKNKVLGIRREVEGHDFDAAASTARYQVMEHQVAFRTDAAFNEAVQAVAAAVGDEVDWGEIVRGNPYLTSALQPQLKYLRPS